MAPIVRSTPMVHRRRLRPKVHERGCVPSRRRFAGALWLAAAFAALAVTLILAGCGGASSSASPSASAGASAVAVARVDGDAVTRGEVDRAIALSRLSAKTLTAKQALEAEIRNQLLRREAARLSVTVGDDAVAARLAQVEASLGGAAVLQSTLSATGLSLADYRQELRDGLLAEALGARKFPAAGPSQAQILAFYRAHRSELTTPAAVRLAEIVVKTKSLGQAVVDRLHQGYPFGEVARAYSMNPDSADPGGVLGWVEDSSLPQGLGHALTTAPRGKLVGPIEAVGEWHVLKVLGRRPAHTQALASARAAIVAQLTTERRATLLSAWLAKARAAAHVTLGP